MNRDNILARGDLANAALFFTAACGASRLHSKIAAAMLERFGDYGAQISGCVRDHFPEHIKNDLRALAAMVTRYSDLGYSARPARVRLDTMRHLARSIATRDGSGFYGPQPYRGENA